jgi:hypothetical protein
MAEVLAGNWVSGCKQLSLACGVAIALAATNAVAQTPSISLIPVKRPSTSLTACPAGETLNYFYYYADVPYYRADSWCGTTQKAVEYSNSVEADNKPAWVTSCVPGEYWTYSHTRVSDPSFLYNSPMLGYVGMVCTPVPAVPPETEKLPQKCDCDGLQAGNPILPATGEKTASQTDLSGQGADALSLVRHYRSGWAGISGRNLAVNPALSQAWSHNHAVSIKWDGVAGTANSVARLIFGDGNVRDFGWDVGSGSWSAGKQRRQPGGQRRRSSVQAPG